MGVFCVLHFFHHHCEGCVMVCLSWFFRFCSAINYAIDIFTSLAAGAVVRCSIKTVDWIFFLTFYLLG